MTVVQHPPQRWRARTEPAQDTSGYIEVAPPETKPEAVYSHYQIDVSGEQSIDIYWLLYTLNITDPCHAHAFKKLAMAGRRGGGKDFEQDMDEALATLQRRKNIKGVKRDT